MAAATGAFVAGGFETVFDGILGPWFLPTFAEESRLQRLDYALVLPSVDVCVERVLTRTGHGFSDVDATRAMHAQFASASLAERHVFRELPDDAGSLAALITARQRDGLLAYPTSATT